MKINKLIAVGTVAMLIAAGCGSDDSSSDGELDKITVVHPYATPSASSAGDALDAVGIKYGFFEEEGLEIVPAYADGSTAAVQLVASGSGDIAAVEVGSVINAVDSGVELSIVASNVVNWPWKMSTLAGSDIQEPEDFAGARIGIISLSSGSYTYTKGFLDQAGLSESDVELIAVGTGPSAVDAIVNDKVDVLALYDSAYNSMLVADPSLELAFIQNPPMFDNVLSLAQTVSTSTLEDDADLIERYLRASTKALLFAAVNPRATVLASWENNPELLGDSTAEELVDSASKTTIAFVASATPLEGDPSSWSGSDFGPISADQWEATNTYLVSAGQVDSPAAMDDIVDTRMMDAIGDFDFGEVIKTAQEAPTEP